MLSHDYLLGWRAHLTVDDWGKSRSRRLHERRRFHPIVSTLESDGKNPSQSGGRVVGNAAKAVAIGALLLAATQNIAAQDKAQIERGMKVYADQKCSACHSIAGKGNQKGALDDVGSRLPADEIRTWIMSPAEMTKKTKAERKPPMRAYPNLAKEDLDAVVAYMVSLKKK
jgi:mono/diheme cytochrome c family protein